MKVVRARVCGYCMGVRRAVELAQEAASASEGRRVYTLGPLIHNPQALEDLERRGVGVLGEGSFPDAAENAVVVIRAHGVPPDAESALAERGVRLLDATCPRVKVSQKKARRLDGEGYRIFLAGEKRHGEIVGILGYAPAALVAGNAAEASRAAEALLAEEGPVKTALIGQTTISLDAFESIASAIQEFFPDLLVVDTICKATKDRQEALRELCAAVEALVVVGGKESANTRHLLEIAREIGVPAWLVETEADLPKEIASYRVVGLSAGASTPDEVVAAVESALASL